MAIWLLQGEGPVVEFRGVAENTKQRKHLRKINEH